MTLLKLKETKSENLFINTEFCKHYNHTDLDTCICNNVATLVESVITENIHTPSTEGIESSWGKRGGGFSKTKKIKDICEVCSKFLERCGVFSPSTERYGYFMELHNSNTNNK